MTASHSTQAESVLLILQGRDPSDHPGIVDGYRRLMQQGVVRHLDIMPVFGPNGVERGKAFWNDVLERVSGNGTTIVVFQYYHSPHLRDPRPAIAAMKQLSPPPFVVCTLGDAFPRGLKGRPSVPRSFLQAVQQAELVTLTSMGLLADFVAKYTESPIMLCPNGACQVRFARSRNNSDTESEFDVIFIGSKNAGRNPLNPHYRFARQRIDLVKALSERFGRNFGLFGNGWDDFPTCQGPVPFEQQANVARRARIIIGGIPHSQERYYTSNRPFIQMTSGVPVADVAVQGVDRILRPNEHWFLAEEQALVQTVEKVLEMEDCRRAAIGSAAAEHVENKHTQAHRVAALVENVRRLRHARENGGKLKPYMPFFLPEVAMDLEWPLATRNWPGIGGGS